MKLLILTIQLYNIKLLRIIRILGIDYQGVLKVISTQKELQAFLKWPNSSTTQKT